MRRTAAIAAVAVGTCAIMASAATARVDASVAIHDFAYHPASTTIGQGSTVTWTNHETAPHTVTSDAAGFFDTGTLSFDLGTSGSAEFASAGTFPYHCEFHASMHGHVRVPIELSSTAPVTVGTRIIIHLASEEVAGRTYDVQRRRGRGEWIIFRTDVASTTTGIRPKKVGRFSFRARVTNDAGGTSRWSPTARIRVMAA
jgi:plastocyanin